MLVEKWKCKVGKVGSRLGLARPALTFVVSDFFQLLTLPTYGPIKFFLDFCIPRRTTPSQPLIRIYYSQLCRDRVSEQKQAAMEFIEEERRKSGHSHLASFGTRTRIFRLA